MKNRQIMRSGKEIIINAPTVCCCKLEIIIVASLQNILEKGKFLFFLWQIPDDGLQNFHEFWTKVELFATLDS